VANDLGLSGFALFGYSFGGGLGLQAAAHLPADRLRAYVESGLDHKSVFEQSQRALDRVVPFLAANIW